MLEKQVEELKWILNEIMETDTNKKPELFFQYTKSINYNSSPENEQEQQTDDDKFKLLSSFNEDEYHKVS